MPEESERYRRAKKYWQNKAVIAYTYGKWALYNFAFSWATFYSDLEKKSNQENPKK